MAKSSALIGELYAAVEGYVKTAFDTLSHRIGLLDERLKALPRPEKGDAGPDADPAVIAAMVAEQVRLAVAALPIPKDGADADYKTIEAFVHAEVDVAVKLAVAAIPRPKDGENGKSVDEGALLVALGERVSNLVAALPKPVNGKDADPEDVRRMVSEAVAAIPKPKDGADADMVALRAAALDRVDSLFNSAPKPKDGKDVDEVAVKRLVEDLVSAAVAARPPARDGKDVDYNAVRGLVFEAVAQAVKDLPKPQDGKDATQLDPHSGIDVNRSYPRGDYALHTGGLWRAAKSTAGMNGWECVLNGIASVAIESETEREFCVKATQTNGTETVARFKMTTPLDKGVWKPDAKYDKGDGVTWSGSWWIAQVDKPTDKPGISDHWRLAVKRGRDGKDGVMKEPVKPQPIRIHA